MTLNKFYTRFIEIMANTKAECDSAIVGELRVIVINEITYFVKAIYKSNTNTTVTDKIQRLIDKDANCS